VIATPQRGDLVFVGDVHLDRDDPDLPAFLAFLERLGPSSRRIVLMGDLFNLWLGRRELEQPHQTAVLERLAGLRRRGVSVRYLEGNRDYRIGPCYGGGALDDSTDHAIVETCGGRRLVAVHGDLANPHDRNYRRWRWFSRLGLVWGLFNLVPRSQRMRWANSMERRLRSSNPEFKGEFPEAAVREYAATLLGEDDDALVLGHFHLELDLAPPPHRVLVLPEWKGSRRHLRVTSAGEIGFVDSE
jgi:UDP-2,3-diacylglucosamine hydrolase